MDLYCSIGTGLSANCILLTYSQDKNDAILVKFGNNDQQTIVNGGLQFVKIGLLFWYISLKTCIYKQGNVISFFGSFFLNSIINSSIPSNSAPYTDYLLTNTEFRFDGNLIGFEFHASNPGSICFYVC